MDAKELFLFFKSYYFLLYIRVLVSNVSVYLTVIHVVYSIYDLFVWCTLAHGMACLAMLITTIAGHML
jgi:hypothetical protein